MKNKIGMSIIVATLSASCPVLAQQAGQPATVDQSQQTQTPATDQQGGARARNSDYVNGQTTGTVVGDQPQGAQAADQTGGARAHDQDYSQGVGKPINSGTGSVTDINAQNQWTGQFGKLERADKLIGRDVYDDEGQKLGTIKDFAVELDNGRLVEAIVGTGGMLGVDESLRAVPPQALTCNEDQKSVKLNITKEKFDSAPSFKKDQWQANMNQDQVQNVYQFYGAKSYWTWNQNTQADQAAAAQQQFGQLVSADKFIGSSVDNLQNDRLGRVHDLIVSLPQARVAEVILSSGGFIGMNNELSAIPPEAFRKPADHNYYQLDTTKEVLANAPHFNGSAWPQFDQQQVAAVYQTYDVKPYWQENAQATANNEQPNQPLNAMSQGMSKNDVAITRHIREDIMADKSLSIEAKNIVVITQHGQVVLRGTVNSQEEKDQLGKIAARDATAGSVDNELTVRATTSSLR